MRDREVFIPLNVGETIIPSLHRRYGLTVEQRPQLPSGDDRAQWATHHLDMAAWEMRQADARPVGSRRRQYCLEMAAHHHARAGVLLKLSDDAEA